MEKHLHKNITTNTSKNLHNTNPIESMQQLHMETEFANELSVLKSIKVEPRPEAVDKLMQLIAQQTVAEHH